MLPRRRWPRVVFVIALGAVGLLFVLRSEAASSQACALLRRELPGQLGLEVGVGRCQLEPLTQSVRVEGLTVFAPDSDVVLLGAEEAQVSLRTRFPFGFAIDSLEVLRPRVNLDLSAPRPARGPPAKPAVCAVQRFRSVQIDRLALKGGALKLRLPQGRAVSLEGLELDWQSRRGVTELTLALGGGEVLLEPGNPLVLGASAVEAQLDADDETLTLTRAELRVEGVDANLSGSLEGLCEADPRLALVAQLFVPLQRAMRVVHGPSAEGHLRARVAVNGRLSSPVVRAEGQGSAVVLGDAAIGDFRVRAAYAGDSITVEELKVPSGSGELSVTGSIGLGKGFPLTAVLATREAPLGRVLEQSGVKGAWVDFPTSLTGTVTGTLSPVNLGGDIDARVGSFVLSPRPWSAPDFARDSILAFKRAQVNFHLQVLRDRVEFQEVRVAAGLEGQTKVHGKVVLHYAQEKGLDVDVTADRLWLADFGNIAQLPWSGELSGDVHLHGPTGKSDLDAQLTGRDVVFAGYALGVVESALTLRGQVLAFPSLVAQKGKTQYFGKVSLDFAPKELHATAQVQVPRGRVEDLVEVLAPLSSTLEPLRGVLTGEVSGQVSIDSPAAELSGSIALQLADVRYFDRRLGGGRAQLRFDDGKALVLEPMVLQGALGTSRADGRWTFAGAGPLDFRMSLEGAALAELISPGAPQDSPVRGPFSAVATVGGDTEALRVDAQLTSERVELWGRTLGPAALQGSLTGKELRVTGSPVSGALMEATARLVDDWPYEAAFKVRFDALEVFLPESIRAQGVTGSTSGFLTAQGMLLAPRRSSLEASLEALTLSRRELTATNDGEVNLRLGNGRLEVRRARVTAPNTELSVAGHYGPRDIDLRARGQVDLRLVEPFLPSLERLLGRAEIAASIGGTVDAPVLAGSAEFADVRFGVKELPLSVRALQARVEFSQNRALVQDVQGFLNEGSLRARGDLRLDAQGLQHAELGLDLSEVSVPLRDGLPGTFSGALLMAGKPGAYQLGGALELSRLRYTQDLTLESLIRDVRQPRLAPGTGKAVEWLKLDVGVDLGSDVRLENNLARARLVGKLKLSGTNVAPLLTGTVETDAGAQAFFRNNTYAIGRGQLVLSSLEPTFDLSARSQVREYLVNVKAFGRLDDPNLSLTSEPALSQVDILSLLTLGFMARERVSSGTATGLAAEALFAASGLDRTVNQFLNSTEVLKDQQVRISTTYNEFTGQAEPSVTWEAGVVSERFRVGITQPVTGRGTRAQVEYRFNDRVSAKGQWDNQIRDVGIGNPGVDLRFRFEWE